MSDQKSEAKKEGAMAAVGLLTNAFQVKEAVGTIKAMRTGANIAETTETVNRTSNALGTLDDVVDFSDDISRIEDAADGASDISRMSEPLSGVGAEKQADELSDVLTGANKLGGNADDVGDAASSAAEKQAKPKGIKLKDI